MQEINLQNQDESESQTNTLALTYDEDFQLQDVMREGRLIETVNQRGDEDSRRFRVFQQYVKSSGQNEQTSKQFKWKKKQQAILYSDATEQSSSDEQSSQDSSEINQKNQTIVKKIASKFIKKQPKEKQGLLQNKKIDVKKKINLLMSINIQKQMINSMKKEKEKEKRLSMLQELKSQQLSFKQAQDSESPEKIKIKRLKQIYDKKNSDEDDQLDEKIQLITQKKNNIKNDDHLFSPDSQTKSIWEVICLLFIFYQAVLIPYRLCFGDDAEGNILIFETIIDAFFIADIFIQFNTSFYRKGKIIKNRKDIIINYLQTWFIIDLVSSVPYNYIFTDQVMMQLTDQLSDGTQSGNPTQHQATPQILRLIKLTRFLRFLRLLRVLKLKQILYKIEELIMSESIVALFNLFKVISIFLIIAHWLACIFFSVGQSEYLVNGFCWFQNDQQGIYLVDSDVEDQYIAALYWSFVTMATVGYGDIVPITNTEKCFVMVAMLVSCGVFAYVVGSIEMIVSQSNTIEQDFQERIINVNQYLISKHIPKQTRIQAKRYLEQMLEHLNNEKMSQQEVLSLLNTNLQDEVLIQIIGKMVTNQRLFVSLFDERILCEIIFMLKQKLYLMDDHIFEEGDKADKFINNENEVQQNAQNFSQNTKNGTGMFFIIQGQIIMFHKKSKTYIIDLKLGKIFGEISFYTGKARSLTARSRGFTELMYLDQYEFQEILQTKHTHLQLKYQELRDQLDNQPSNLSPLFIYCYLCKQKGHISINCLFFSEIQGNMEKKKDDQDQQRDIIIKEANQLQEQIDNELQKFHQKRNKSMISSKDSDAQSVKSIQTQKQLSSSPPESWEDSDQASQLQQNQQE